MLQVKIKFRLKFFKIGWFTISLCLLALTIHELGLHVGDKGNWESTKVKNNFNLHKTFWLGQLGQLGKVETIRAGAKVLAQANESTFFSCKHSLKLTQRNGRGGEPFLGANIHHVTLYPSIISIRSKYPSCNIIYYIDMSVLLENIQIEKFIKTTSGTQVVYFP